MSAAHAVATKNVKDEAATSRSHKNARTAPRINPGTQPGFSGEQIFIQRKENACACGGGCPKCLGNAGIQAKLKIGAPNDVYEQEADRVADAVMRMPEPKVQRQAEFEEEQIQTKSITPLVQRQTEPEEDEEAVPEREEESTPILESVPTRDADELDEENLLQAKATPGHTPQVTPNVAANIQNFRGGGQPLPANQRHFFESRMGHDFSGVRIHTDSKAADTAQKIQAKAFTLGNNIVFNTGQYSRDNQKGKKLLAHELTHVVQQGTVPRIRLNTHPISQLSGIHAEAPSDVKTVRRQSQTGDKPKGTLPAALRRKKLCDCSKLKLTVPKSSEVTWLNKKFPRLDAGDWCITGKGTPKYNCYAWSVGETSQPIWAKKANPPKISDLDTLYAKNGLKPAPKGKSPADPEVALFGKGSKPLHAARKSSYKCSGAVMFESKMGAAPRIIHPVRDLQKGVYGDIIRWYVKK